MARSGPGHRQSLQRIPGLLTGWPGPKHLRHLLLRCRMHTARSQRWVLNSVILRGYRHLDAKCLSHHLNSQFDFSVSFLKLAWFLTQSNRSNIFSDSQYRQDAVCQCLDQWSSLYTGVGLQDCITKWHCSHLRLYKHSLYLYKSLIPILQSKFHLQAMHDYIYKYHRTQESKRILKFVLLHP